MMDWIGRFFRPGRMLRDVRGNVAVLTAIALPTLMLAIGGGMDYARMLDAKTRLQTAADAALLATMSHRKVNPTIPTSRLATYFKQQMRLQYRQRLQQRVIRLGKIVFSLKKDRQGAEIASARARGRIKTTFLRFAAINEMSIGVEAEAKIASTRTEVALVLDVTGSMAGSKIQELKKAATRFVNTIYNRVRRKRPEDFRIAIVPFSQYVNVGMKYRRASWIDVPPDGYRTKTKTSVSCTYRRCVRYRYGGTRCSWTGPRYRSCRRVCRWVRIADAGYKRVCSIKCTWKRRKICTFDPRKRVCVRYRTFYRFPCRISTRQERRYIKWQGCVGSRRSPLLQESAAGGRIPGVMNYTRNTQFPEMHYDGYTWTANTCPFSALLPLVSVKTQRQTLLQKIYSLRANGYTYIPSGLMWGWRVLSHNKPFTQSASDSEVKKYNVQKVIVLMTDGANTRAPDRRSNRAYKDHGSSSTTYANQLTTQLCNKIKAINPATGRRHAEIVTITFNVTDGTIKRLLRNCSTLGSYDVKKGQLTKIFEQVADQLAELHLSR